MTDLPKQYEIFVLLEGYSYEDKDGRYRANGSSTLISGSKTIIVDTGSPHDGDKIIKRLAKYGANAAEVDYVVCTHGHSDHVGNLNLFPNAKFIVGFDMSEGDHYLDHDFKGGKPYQIDDDVEVIPTPGHTHSDVSVLVRNVKDYGTVVVCGDLFEKEDDDTDWRNVSEWEEKQGENREKIIEIADYLVPGHGPMFAVKKSWS